MTSGSAALPRTWRPRPRIASPWLRWGLILGVLFYLGLACGSLEIDPARIRFGVARFFESDAAFQWRALGARVPEVLAGMGESLAMTVVATPLGILLSIPVGFGAARNVAPLPVYVVCRALTVISRGFHEIVIAILFVKMIGFGALAGVLTLVVATVGFYGKLLAEAIEETDPAVDEAMRATGAGWGQRMVFGVLPQVRPRLVGLGLYRFDINLRESTVIGLVGAGGIGATLKTTFDRHEYLGAIAILALIIGLVFVLEWGAGHIRRRCL